MYTNKSWHNCNNQCMQTKHETVAITNVYKLNLTSCNNQCMQTKYDTVAINNVSKLNMAEVQ